MPRARWRIRVEGIVQGVGFRPAVWRYATALDLAGSVRNEGAAVLIDVEGETPALARLRALLEHSPPPRARIASIACEEAPPRGGDGFAIEPSADALVQRRVPPDMATCPDCLAEIRDPSARRSGYPFTNCTNCGPRYTIIADLPYDRVRTSMAAFAMCEDCRREYEDPSDRRFHAQPIACPRCGPALRFTGAGGEARGGEALARAVETLLAGRILAVKGLGGYHLACAAEDREAVARLRRRKGREAKPFAVMAPDLESAERLAELDPVARALLTGPERPIVLLPRKDGCGLPEDLAPGLRRIGLFLPYTPLHDLLCAGAGRPLVMTSGNLTDDPIARTEEDAARRLGGIADAFLEHDRPILRRCEDSVVAAGGGRSVMVRRARGYAPAPIAVRRAGRATILAVGGDLKNTFCLLAGPHAFVSPHLGELRHLAAFEQFRRDIADVEHLLGARPDAVACDLHPDYLAAAYAHERGLPVVRVQHHHAHIAACLAEHGEEGPAIGVAFDGLGMGPGGELWGGEFLVASLDGFRRAAHLAPLLLPGGEKAEREPWRVAIACLAAAAPEALDAWIEAEAGGRDAAGIKELLARDVNCVPVSSAGRLFDAVAAIAGVCLESSYEGEAAMRLEDLVRDDAPGPDYELPLDCASRPFRLRWEPLVAGVWEDRRRGVPAECIAARFHRGLAAAVCAVCARLRDDAGPPAVALSGGVFHNSVLTAMCVRLLEARGFRVLAHRDFPPGDGGISLGQALIADRKLAQ
ncbi:MAG TPA: carbamoyltransferase HypF [Planctomycetes bacterium]|nr:carbamoyltransferase HypF [Planctomycetota bacterium]